MWFLVAVHVMFTVPSSLNEPYVKDWWAFKSMDECFSARDQVLVDIGAVDGMPPKGLQLVCINNSVETDEQERNRRELEYKF